MPFHSLPRLTAVSLAALPLAVGVGACARTDLDPADVEVGESREPNTVVDAGPDSEVPDVEVPDVEIPDVEVPDDCVPATETCNGLDDDCNGQVDDDLPPVPCPDGGFSYCVRGTMSECPRECDICVPGSETICFVSYCYFWGVQTCAGDGKSLSGCIEEHPPSNCEGIARDHQKSRQLEQCCIDEGLCCKDDFDLDHDGDTGDYVGNCSEVTCGRD